MNVPAWLKRSWHLPLQAAAAAVAAASGFFGRPSYLGEDVWGLALTRALLTLVACFFLWGVARRLSRPGDWVKWLAAGLLLLAAALGALWLQFSWTCYSELRDRRFVVGETFTAGAIGGRKFREARLRGRQVTDEQAVGLLRADDPCRLVEGAEGPEAVWETAEVRGRERTLAVLYVSVAPLFFAGFFGAAQALYCSGRRDAKEPARTPGRKVFISYASDDAPLAEEVGLALVQEGYEVFHDRSRLKPGEGYHRMIRHEVLGADLFVFLISPASVESGRYTLTELGFAREKWPDPAGRVLAVVARDTPMGSIPQYLKATTLLQPTGSVAAEVAAAVERLAAGPPPPHEDISGVAR